MAEERDPQQLIGAGEIGGTDEDSLTGYFGIEWDDMDATYAELENNMGELPVVFIALGFLSELRINELLEAKLSRYRWAAVFDYRREDDVNTIVLDPLFSFARWGEAIVTGRYEMMAAVEQNGEALLWASDELKNDRGVVMAAVKQGGDALQWASDELKNDRGVVMAAVKQDGGALQFASNELQNDRGVVMAAVEQSGWALRFASNELKQELGS